jgi:hypothetical protein
VRLPQLANPWALLGGLILVIGLVAGAYIKGGRDARNAEAAAAAREEKIGQIAYDNAQRAAAEAIAGITIKHVTTKQTLEKEIIRDPIYRDCVHSDPTFELLNQLLQGAPGKSSGGRELSPVPGGPQ